MKRHKQQAGFTIVEVMITLAIAGLIILMVLLVVPALKRNSRNYIYKHYVSTITAQMESYRGINNHYPRDDDEQCDFIKNYVATKDTASPCEDDTTKQCQIADIGPVEICFHDNWASHAYIGPPGEISLIFAHWCNTPTHTDGTSNTVVSVDTESDYTKYVVWATLESGKIYCADNSPN